MKVLFFVELATLKAEVDLIDGQPLDNQEIECADFSSHLLPQEDSNRPTSSTKLVEGLKARGSTVFDAFLVETFPDYLDRIAILQQWQRIQWVLDHGADRDFIRRIATAKTTASPKSDDIKDCSSNSCSRSIYRNEDSPNKMLPLPLVTADVGNHLSPGLSPCSETCLSETLNTVVDLPPACISISKENGAKLTKEHFVTLSGHWKRLQTHFGLRNGKTVVVDYEFRAQDLHAKLVEVLHEDWSAAMLDAHLRSFLGMPQSAKEMKRVGVCGNAQMQCQLTMHQAVFLQNLIYLRKQDHAVATEFFDSESCAGSEIPVPVQADFDAQIAKQDKTLPEVSHPENIITHHTADSSPFNAAENSAADVAECGAQPMDLSPGVPVSAFGRPTPLCPIGGPPTLEVVSARTRAKRKHGELQSSSLEPQSPPMAAASTVIVAAAAAAVTTAAAAADRDGPCVQVSRQTRTGVREKFGRIEIIKSSSVSSS